MTESASRSDDNGTPRPGPGITLDELVAGGADLQGPWLPLRRGRHAQRPPDPLLRELGEVLDAVGVWIRSGADEVGPDLKGRFQKLAMSYRQHGYELEDTLYELAEVEDALSGLDASGRAASHEAQFRRAMRNLITETVRLNHALDARRHREHGDAVRTFGEILSHELGNRLGAARTGVDLLKDPLQTVTDERRKEILTLVADGIDAALETVDDVQAFMDAQKWTARDAIALPEVIRRVVRGVRPLARRNGVDVAVEEPVPDTAVPAAQLRLVLSNLVVNGVRYHDPEKEERWVRVRASEEPDGLHMQVADNGLGIDPADRERIFQYRERGGNGADAPEGSGLGLAIVREALQQLGGRATLETEPGQGSTFHVHLPLDPEAAPAS